MAEYIYYKGYYIGPGAFNNKAEIEQHIKAQSIESYKTFCKCFAMSKTIEGAVILSEKADWMHEHLGMSYEEIEAIEIETFKEM